MARYELNPDACDHVHRLIESRQYVLESDWGDVQPGPRLQDVYLDRHSWTDYGAWHLGLTAGATEETKGRYAFVVGDFRRVHRTGLIACVYRAAQWRHKAVERAAYELLQALDERAGITG